MGLEGDFDQKSGRNVCEYRVFVTSKEFFIDNLLIRIHFIIKRIW